MDTVDPEKWPLTSRAIAYSERANRGLDLDDDDEPEQGSALIRMYGGEYEVLGPLGEGVLYGRVRP